MGASMRWGIAGCLLSVLLVACAPIRERSRTMEPVGQELIASIGDPILRVARSENMPNLVGGSDIFGRRRATGYAELRYYGLDRSGQPIFGRIDTEIRSNETTMSQGLSMSGQTIRRGYRQQWNVEIPQQDPTILALPPNVTVIPLNLAETNVITFGRHSVRILAVHPSLVRYMIHDSGSDRPAAPSRAAASSDPPVIPSPIASRDRRVAPGLPNAGVPEAQPR
jgi:hypothetical protein